MYRFRATISFAAGFAWRAILVPVIRIDHQSKTRWIAVKIVSQFGTAAAHRIQVDAVGDAGTCRRPFAANRAIIGCRRRDAIAETDSCPAIRPELLVRAGIARLLDKLHAARDNVPASLCLRVTCGNQGK